MRKPEQTGANIAKIKANDLKLTLTDFDHFFQYGILMS